MFDSSVSAAPMTILVVDDDKSQAESGLRMEEITGESLGVPKSRLLAYKYAVFLCAFTYNQQ